MRDISRKIITRGYMVTTRLNMNLYASGLPLKKNYMIFMVLAVMTGLSEGNLD